MTDYIRDHGLLPAAEVEKLWAEAPKEIVGPLDADALGLVTPSWHDFIEAFTPEDGVGEIPLPRRVPLPLAGTNED
jgi:hypothetical protein